MYYWAAPGSPWRGTQVAGAGETFVSASIVVRPDGQADIAALRSGTALMYYCATPGSAWHGTQLQ